MLRGTLLLFLCPCLVLAYPSGADLTDVLEQAKSAVPAGGDVGPSDPWWLQPEVFAPTQSKQCDLNFDCVPFHLCVDGVITETGEGLIDLRTGHSAPKEGPYRSCGDAGTLLCCRIPDAYLQPEPPLPPVHPPLPGPGPAPIRAQCPFNSDCVPFFQCGPDGYIKTGGEDLIDVRVKPPSQCSHPEFPEVPGTCCLIPDAPKPDECPAEQVCVHPTECNPDGTMNTDGSGLIDTRAKYSQCYLGPNLIGTCCLAPPPPVPEWPRANECGVRNYAENSEVYTKIQDYSVADKEAHFGEFPWQAIIFFSNYTFKCGGSLISDQFIMTAAHCVSGFYPSDLKVRLGEWQVNSFEEPLPYVDVNIQEIIIHPYYNPKSVHNGIAILKLASPVTTKYHINSICLPHYDTVFPAGTRCIATGWGKDAWFGDYQHIIKKIELPLVDKDRCQILLRNTRLGKYFKLHESFMCAGGEENKDACRGDGGGPLVCLDPATGRYDLVGITAWGIGCGQRDVPGVYIDVKFFDEWIKNVITGSQVEPPGSVRVPGEACHDDQVCKVYEQCISDHTATVYEKGTVDVTVFGDYCYLDPASTVNSVCCDPVYIPTPPPPSIPPPAEGCGHRNLDPDEGIYTRVQNHQVGHNEAHFGEFPWQGIVFFQNYTFKCGASLITPKHLLTAAHCVAGYSPSDFKIRLGEWQVNSFDEPIPYEDRDVAHVTIHEGFNERNAHNDIAVVEITEPVLPQYHINFACVPDDHIFVPPGTRCIVTGWGKDAWKGRYQQKMKQVELPFVDRHVCEDLLRHTRLGKYFKLHDSFICAGGEENRDACKGDGGGPLICPDPTTGDYMQVGITAWGIGCGKKDVPGVYVDVPHFHDWIYKVIGNQ